MKKKGDSRLKKNPSKSKLKHLKEQVAGNDSYIRYVELLTKWLKHFVDIKMEKWTKHQQEWKNTCSWGRWEKEMSRALPRNLTRLSLLSMLWWNIRNLSHLKLTITSWDVSNKRSNPEGKKSQSRKQRSLSQRKILSSRICLGYNI